MKEPERIPLDPSTPRAKSVQIFPLHKTYPENIKDDLYDDLYIKNQQLDINPYPTFDRIINWEKSLYEDNKQNDS